MACSLLPPPRCAPDPIDFRALLPLDIYSRTNAFRKRVSVGVGVRGGVGATQLKESVTGSARTYTGDMLASLEDDYRFEAARHGQGGRLGGASAGHRRRMRPHLKA